MCNILFIAGFQKVHHITSNNSVINTLHPYKCVMLPPRLCFLRLSEPHQMTVGHDPGIFRNIFTNCYRVNTWMIHILNNDRNANSGFELWWWWQWPGEVMNFIGIPG